MKLLPIADAAKLSGVADRTIRLRIEEGLLTRYEDEQKGIMLVDKREVLSIIPTAITIFNHKGGCGKTSLSVLTADYYEKKQIKTLLIDLDPQMNLTKTFLSYEQIQESKSLYNFFASKTPLNKIVREYSDFIDIIPNDLELTEEKNYDIPELYSFTSQFNKLFKNYQIIILDCPPGVNFLTKLGLILCNYLYMPFVPEPYNYDGLVGAIKFKNKYIDFMKNYIDFKIIVSAHEQRKINVHEYYINRIKEEVGEDHLFNHTIPNFVGLKERGSSFTNIFDAFTEGDKSLKKVRETLDEMNNFIYDERGNNK
jgi:chromosome partitioning protein